MGSIIEIEILVDINTGSNTDDRRH